MTQENHHPRSAWTQEIREYAHTLGFEKVGFAPAGNIDPEQKLRAWLERGFGQGMDYMSRTAEARTDPARLVPGARSVVALATSYFQPDVHPEGPLKVSRYATGDDYHRIIQRRVRKLRKRILRFAPQAKVHPSVDTSAVLERAWAARAGVGWVGKSTMAISPELGTYTFLASLITDIEFVYDAPHPDRCGSCTRCLDACPTDAFVEPYVLDARRCITTWNVEHRGDFPTEEPKLHGWVAGCDVCQEVCPWNKFAKTSQEPRFAPREGLRFPDRTTFTDPSKHDVLFELLKGTALARNGPEAIRRNAEAVLRQAADPDSSPNRLQHANSTHIREKKRP